MSVLTGKERKLFEKISRKAGRTILEYGMIGEGDRVLVGLSGGKDSMILLEILADRKRHFPFDFGLSAVHVSAGNIGYVMDTEYLRRFCSGLQVPLYLEEIEVDPGTDPEKAPCFVCSWNRRKRIFEMSGELDCNKVALGHHRDDAIETLLMNMIYHGSISSLPHTLSMFDGRIRLIRPLLRVPEAELSGYAGIRQFRKHEKTCPYDGSTRREEIRGILRQIEKMSGDARRNMFNSMDNIYPEYLPKK